ncbi:MAG: hypothetical protein GF398_20060 [Chitinivibrionales bacterium]|nr:hypothetical protein [Chitinivibrionales bacterium]
MSWATGVAVDFDPTTAEIDSVLDLSTKSVNDPIIIGIKCLNVQNLDTYSFDLSFNPASLEFTGGYKSLPMPPITNFMESNGGELIEASFGLKGSSIDTVNVAFSLTGSDSSTAPDGNGVIALASFKILTIQTNWLKLHNVEFLDYAHDILTVDSAANGKLEAQVTAIRHLASGFEHGASFQNRASCTLLGRMLVSPGATANQIVIQDRIRTLGFKP